jgi:hypothetical protein
VISILDLPPPHDVWEGDTYWGVLYYHYPDAIGSMHFCRDSTEVTYLPNELCHTILDMERDKYIAPMFSFEGFEGEIVIFYLKAIRDPEDSELYVDAQKVIRRIEDVKRASIAGCAG